MQDAGCKWQVVRIRTSRQPPTARGRPTAARRPPRSVLTVLMIDITDHLALDERELDERFVRASGPGGQNVNKVATAVQLRFDVHASSLPDELKRRLLVLAGKRVTADGVLVIDSREHRTQAQNREAARERLVKLLQQASHRPRTRRPTRPTAGSRERRIQSKKKRAKTKEGRRAGGEE